MASSATPLSAPLERLKHARWAAPLWIALAWPIGILAAAYCWIVRRTSRVVIEGHAFPGPAVYVSWHRYMPFLVGFHGASKRVYISSPEPYMLSMSVWARLQGAGIEYGTTMQGGRDALERLGDHLVAGRSVALAVDGPAGPVFRVKRGCIALAQEAGVPVVPVAYASHRGVERTGRWDRQSLTVPFDRITVRLGSPVEVKGLSSRAAVDAVQAALDALEPVPLARPARARTRPPAAGPAPTAT
jgi:lysophospholipid acyltransferase (LPLAT)-like uncharacterized protein